VLKIKSQSYGFYLNPENLRKNFCSRIGKSVQKLKPPIKTELILKPLAMACGFHVKKKKEIPLERFGDVNQ